MTDDQLLHLASVRMLILPTPINQIELPPPPAAHDESAAMWHPADRPGDMERVPLTQESDRSAAAIMGFWMGMQALEIARPDPAQKPPRPFPRKDDEREPLE